MNDAINSFLKKNDNIAWIGAPMGHYNLTSPFIFPLSFSLVFWMRFLNLPFVFYTQYRLSSFFESYLCPSHSERPIYIYPKSSKSIKPSIDGTAEVYQKGKQNINKASLKIWTLWMGSFISIWQERALSWHCSVNVELSTWAHLT